MSLTDLLGTALPIIQAPMAGVQTSALAIAKHYGCPAAVTSRHQWKLDKAKALGADLCVLDSLAAVVVTQPCGRCWYAPQRHTPPQPAAAQSPPLLHRRRHAQQPSAAPSSRCR